MQNDKNADIILYFVFVSFCNYSLPYKVLKTTVLNKQLQNLKCADS